MLELNKEMVEKLKVMADKDIASDEEDFDLHGACGGQYDDAYSIGYDDGEVGLARWILSEIVEK